MPAVAALTLSVEVPDPPTILPGLVLAVRPDVPVVVRVTVEVKWFIGLRVMTDVPTALTLILRVDGFAVRLKSLTNTIMVVL